MQLKSLEIFLMVVKLGSFSEAAKQLYTVQSNVTSHIKKLENELQVEILSRQNPITPTRAGQQLYESAKQIIDLQQNILHSFLHQQQAKHFPLAIGSMETTAAVRLPILLQHLQQIDAELPLVLSTGSSRDLIDQVKAAQLDCAFIANTQPVAGCFNLHVWTEEMVLISTKNAPQILSNEYLSQKKFIAFKQGCSYRASIELFLSLRHLPSSNIMEMGSLDAIVSCVSLDLGLAILPLSYLQQSYFYPHIRIHPLPDQLAHIPTYLIADLPSKWGSNMTSFLAHLKSVLVQPSNLSISSNTPL